jgi:hypothetical protein
LKRCVKSKFRFCTLLIGAKCPERKSTGLINTAF